MLLLILSLGVAGLTLAIFLSRDVNLNVDAGAPAEAYLVLPKFSSLYGAVFTALVLAAFVLLLRRLVAAWKMRSRNAGG
ncbi:MAG: hypothetical protein H0V21_00165 [Rubrobacter sp.]|nr:hypothetical protein [Rubrobacter sp.]